MNSETFTLTELADPTNNMCSTLGIKVSNGVNSVTSFSTPPFLYYATKARLLVGLGISDESQITKESGINIPQLAINAIRQRASNIYDLIAIHKVEVSSYVSTYIQAQILGDILGDQRKEDFSVKNFKKKPSVSLCITRTKKNVTVPLYLLERLTDLVQSEKTARRLIHELAFQTGKKLEEKNLLDEERKIIGEAGNASWSRKIHNLAFMELIKHSNIKELSGDINIFNVKVTREPTLEMVPK